MTTTRELLAGLAMAGDFAALRDPTSIDPAERAKLYVRYADALIEALSATGRTDGANTRSTPATRPFHGELKC